MFAVPLAHLGHYAWVFYAVPALIVAAATVHSALVQRRARRNGAPPRSRD